MPQRQHYEGMSLAEALVAFAEHHGAQRTRHITMDEQEMLLAAAAIVEQHAAGRRAFP